MGAHADPRVLRFLQSVSLASAEEAREEEQEARTTSPAGKWRQLVSLSKSLAWIRTQPPAQQARVLEWRDPPAASYRALIARLHGAPGE